MEQQARILELRHALENVIVGQGALLDRLVIGLLCGGHILVEGLPGLAKTTAIKALAAIFLPAFLLVLGALPHWNQWRRRPVLRSTFDGVNAAVVGILLAALYNPIFLSAVRGPGDLALAISAFALLMFWKVSPLWVVVFAALGGSLLA